MSGTSHDRERNRHPIAQLRADVKAALPTFALPDERSQERMSSVLMVAVERDPELLVADRQSLIAAVRQCANHGLVPDGNEATLQVYNTKVKDPDGTERWSKKVQYQPMVRGIINRVQKSGKVKTFWADVVYANEDFTIDASDGERRPFHRKISEFDRGADEDIVGAYSVAKMKDGTVDCEPMSRAEIEKVRAVAKTRKVWDGWFAEKCKVAVLRRHSKRLPLSAEDLDMILNREEFDFSREPLRDVTPAKGGFISLAETAKRKAIQGPKDRSDDERAVDETEIRTRAFLSGQEAALENHDRSSCPHKDQPDLAFEWLAGFDSVTESDEGVEP